MEIDFNSRSRKHSEFSNFHPDVIHNSLTYIVDNPLSIRGQRTLEHAFQIEKFIRIDRRWADYLLSVSKSKTALEMKQLGNTGKNGEYFKFLKSENDKLAKISRKSYKTLFEELVEKERDVWRPYNKALMKRLLREKFFNVNYKSALLNTGNASLHEIGRGNGVWIKSGNDWLGQLLMEIREEYSNQSKQIKNSTEEEYYGFLFEHLYDTDNEEEEIQMKQKKKKTEREK